MSLITAGELNDAYVSFGNDVNNAYFEKKVFTDKAPCLGDFLKNNTILKILEFSYKGFIDVTEQEYRELLFIGERI